MVGNGLRPWWFLGAMLRDAMPTPKKPKEKAPAWTRKEGKNP